MSEENIGIEEVIIALKKRVKVIMIIPIIVIILVSVFMKLTSKVSYQSTAKIFVGNSVTDSNEGRFDFTTLEMYQKLMKTYIEIANNPDLIEKALQDRGLDIELGEVIKGISVDQVTDTQMLEISYKSGNKTLTPIVLDAIINNFTKRAEEFIPNGTLKVIEEVKEQPETITTNIKKNTIMAGAISFFFAIGVVALTTYLDNSIRKKEYLESLTNVPVLGVIPVEK